VTELPTSAASSSTRPTRGTVVPYDFRKPTKLSRENTRMLQMAYDVFARRLTTILTGGLRQVCQITLNEISQRSYDEYINSLQPQTLMVPLVAHPLPGTGIIEFSLPIALTAIDHMLGGPGGAQTPRSLTDIETTLINGMIDQILGALRYALESIVPITTEIGAIEYNPQFLQAASPADSMIVGEFEMIIGQEQSTLTLCLPMAPLLPRLAAQRPQNQADKEADALAAQTARRLRDRLGDVPIDVSVLFSPAALSPERILTLAPGDIVPLAHRVGDPLTVRAGGITYARAVAGKAGNRLAALVVDTSVDVRKEHM